jgi:hypothetical protein
MILRPFEAAPNYKDGRLFVLEVAATAKSTRKASSYTAADFDVLGLSTFQLLEPS